MMSMIAKLNQLNQVELPEQAVDAVGRPAFFDVVVEDGRLVLTPSMTSDAVIDKLERLDLEPSDIDHAVAWARQQR